MLTGPSVGLAAETVTVVVSEHAPAYDEVAAVIRASLRNSAEVTTLLPRELDAARTRARVMVGVGVEACRTVLEAPGATPVVCTLVPRSAFERATRTAALKGRPVSAVVLDQPLSRQMALIRIALPSARHIAVLYGPDSFGAAAAVTAAAAEHGLRISSARADEPSLIYPALQKALGDADVLLALPDANVFNSSTIQNILRTTFQERVPVLGFSPAYVRSGALFAVYSTPQHVGRETARMLAAFLAGRQLPPPQSPREFDVSVNAHVARLLGMTIADEVVLSERLHRTEQTR